MLCVALLPSPWRCALFRAAKALQTAIACVPAESLRKRKSFYTSHSFSLYLMRAIVIIRVQRRNWKQIICAHHSATILGGAARL